MKRSHVPRRWRWIRATGAVISAVIALAYGLTLFWGLKLQGQNSSLVVQQGAAMYVWLPERGWEWPLGVHVFPQRGPLTWWFDIRFGASYALGMPLWAPLLAFALPTAYAWHRCRRFPPGRCQKCGYDLSGNTTGVCPECGRPAGTLKA